MSWKIPALRGSQLLRDNIKANRWQSSQSYEEPAPSSARGAEPQEVPVPWGQLTKWDPVTPKFTQPSPVRLLCFVLFVIQSVIAVLWLWSMGEVLALFNWGRNIHLSLICIDSVKDSRIRGVNELPELYLCHCWSSVIPQPLYFFANSLSNIIQ